MWYLTTALVMFGLLGCIVLLGGRPQDERVSDDWRRAHVGHHGDGEPR